MSEWRVGRLLREASLELRTEWQLWKLRGEGQLLQKS